MQIIQNVFDFIQEQLLGMKWLNELIGKILSFLGLDLTTQIGASIQFFIYDMIKILGLLSILIFIISYIQSYFPPERTKKILGKHKGFMANFMGALLGTVTPFCSCSSIPLFIGFTNAGLPVGVTFSFLISSPLVDLGAFILLSSVFGFKVAIVYVIVGIILAVVGGKLIDKFGLEKYVEQYIKTNSKVNIIQTNLKRKDRLTYANEQMCSTVIKVFWYVVIGVGIGAAIHNWIPQQWVEMVLSSDNPFSVLIATAV
ncbi:MAG: permease, partial [Oscillospiraceae bacterium]